MRRALPVSALLSSCLLLLSACEREPTVPEPTPVESDAPTVTATTPTSGDEALAPGALTQVRITFSTPMDTARGTARASSGLTLGAPTWSGDTLTLPITRVEHDEAYTVTLEGFQDARGRPVEHTVRFRTGTDRPRPALTRSSIAEGTPDEYPVQLYFDARAKRPGIYLRKQVSLRFSVPMRGEGARVTLRNHTDASIELRILTGEWTDGGRELRLTLPTPEEGGPGSPVLEEKTHYSLDLSELRSAEVGNRLDPVAVLGDGRLDFTTSARDGEVEHACTHAIASETEAIEATTGEAPPFGFAPLTDTGHARYRVTLPGGEKPGYTSLISLPDEDEHVTVYLDRALSVGVYDGTANQEATVKVETARPACEGITRVVSFHVHAGNRDYFLRFGPVTGSVFEFILERSTH